MKDGRAEGEKVAKAIEQLKELMARYSDVTLDGESLEDSISERVNKCKELNELLDSAYDASQGKDNSN
jgi:CHASE3 domain sensor protein